MNAKIETIQDQDIVNFLVNKLPDNQNQKKALAITLGIP